MPPASPHNRKTGPSGEEEEEEDLVDKLIRNTGCEKEHYLVQVVELQPNHAHRYHQSRKTTLSGVHGGTSGLEKVPASTEDISSLPQQWQEESLDLVDFKL